MAEMWLIRMTWRFVVVLGFVQHPRGKDPVERDVYDPLKSSEGCEAELIAPDQSVQDLQEMNAQDCFKSYGEQGLEGKRNLCGSAIKLGVFSYL